MDNDKRGQTTAESLQEFSQALNQLLMEMFRPIIRPLERPMVALDAALDRMVDRYPALRHLGLVGRITNVLLEAIMWIWLIAGILIIITIVMQ